jgi:hypothetical protein
MLTHADLFGHVAHKPKRGFVKREGAALIEVLLALRVHPAVGWHERMNSGAVRIDGRFVRFGFPGCPDILGQMKDGRLLAVEVKSPKGKPRPEQSEFIDKVRRAGGVAFIARNLVDVRAELTADAVRHLQTQTD